jgi:predicted outer membrane repeat protein
LLVRNNQTAGRGAFYLGSKGHPNSQILFLNSTFTGNNAVEGGAIATGTVYPGYPNSGVAN